MLKHLRALFVTFHLIAITAVAFPAPVGMRKSDLDNPDVKNAIEAWRGAAGVFGFDVDPDAFRDGLWEKGNTLLDGRKAALEPLQPYYRYTGTRQGWSMFGYLNHTPARVEIHIDHGEGWQPLYIARTTAHTWRSHQLDQERLRGLMNSFSWKRGRAKLRQITDWIALQAAEDFPQAQRIRVQMHARPLPDPATLRQQGELEHTKIYWPEIRELQ